MATTDDPPKRARPTKAASAKVSRAYLRALNDHDLDAAAACWEPGGRDVLHGQAELVAPDGIREYFGGLMSCVPDLCFEELSCTAQADRCTIRSRLTGTFAGTRRWNGITPNGARLDLEVVDNFVVRDGLLVANDAYLDGMTVARQLGLLPAARSPAEQRLTRAFNLRTKLLARMVSGPEKVADGVWVLRGGFPARTMNVYLIEEADGVTVFDAGIRSMTNAIAAAGARMGGIRRVVLGHGHADHRGAAPGLAAPVLCHPDNRVDAEGDGGRRYADLSQLNPLGRAAYPHLLRRWDGGPVAIAGTVCEGDEVAGFRVVDIPGHAPGMIALWRESDRVALTSDCFYMVDPQTGRAVPPRVPHPAFNLDTAQARASMRKIAALEPAVACPGHLGPLTGDVRGALERAAGGVVGKRHRQRSRERPTAPATGYEHPEFGVLELRGALTAKTRAEYTAIGGVREDAWQRRVEFLFERLAVRWTIHDLPIERQKELLARFRVASGDERAWMRDVLRAHLAENFPEVSAP